jgi:hypothetical protein
MWHNVARGRPFLPDDDPHCSSWCMATFPDVTFDAWEPNKSFRKSLRQHALRIELLHKWMQHASETHPNVAFPVIALNRALK